MGDGERRGVEDGGIDKIAALTIVVDGMENLVAVPDITLRSPKFCSHPKLV
jgi:hypothetical protein